MYKEIKANFYSMPDDYVLMYCISADFELGAGINREFRRLGVRGHLIRLHRQYYWEGEGYDLVTYPDDHCPYFVHSIVTKEKYSNKPNFLFANESALSPFPSLSLFLPLETMRQVLCDAAKNAYLLNHYKIAIPRIGCVFDRLDWRDVRNLIKSCSSDNYFDITVCYL